MKKTFENKVVIITGSSQGIGLKTAELFAQRGAKVVINSRSREKVENACNRIKMISPNVIGIAGDVSNYDFCVQLRNYTVENFGKIDILINNAGIASGGSIKNMVPQHFETVTDINLLGSVYPTLACVNDICAQKGAILFMSSVAGIVGIPTYTAYCSTKRAVVAFAESIKNELWDDGVFVGINYPIFTENEENKIILNAQGEEEVLQKREGVKIISREETCLKILRQIEKRKFRVYSSFSAQLVQWGYRFFPSLTLKIIWFNRKKIERVQ